MLIEILIICAVLVFLVARIDKMRRQKQMNAVPNTPGVPTPQVPGAVPSQAPNTPRTVRTMAIDGTNPFPVDKAAFFGQFGVPFRFVQEARCYSGKGDISTFPEKVALAIRKLYDDGQALGPEIMRIIFHERKLAEDEALYFALACDNKQEYTMYAFLDKVR